MKMLLVGIGLGIGFFGACLICGSRLFDNVDLSLAEEIEDDGFITVYPKVR